MRARTKWAISLGAIFVLISVGGLALGDYVYREGTSVPCEINADDLPNSPSQFFTPGIDNGPFPGSGWDKWVDYDLSEWWITDIPVDEVTIPGAGGVQLAAWWIRPTYPAAQETVIVTHGYGTSRRDYNALLPSSMLA